MTNQEPKKQSIIGKQVQLRGYWEGTDSLTIYGRFDGQIALSANLTIAPSATVVANIVADQVIIEGTVMGNINARELVHLCNNGKVVGDIIAPQITLDVGAIYKGNMSMTSLQPLASLNTNPSFDGFSAVAADHQNLKTNNLPSPLNTDTSISAKDFPQPPSYAGKKFRVHRKP